MLACCFFLLSFGVRMPAEYPGWMLERQGGARRAQMG